MAIFSQLLNVLQRSIGPAGSATAGATSVQNPDGSALASAAQQGQMLAVLNTISSQLGSGATRGHFVAAEDIRQGEPLYVSRANGMAYVADAGSYASAFVLGLADATVAAGHVVGVVVGPVLLADWSAITGNAALRAGQNYFLAGPGQLSLIAPSRPQFAASCVVGAALDASTLLVNPAFPIML